MSESLTITESELLEELAAIWDAGAEDAKTAQELADAAKLSLPVIRRVLKGFQAAGRLKAYRVRRPAIDGRMLLVPAYTIQPKAAPAKRR